MIKEKLLLKKIKRKQSIVKPKDKRASVGYNQMINI